MCPCDGVAVMNAQVPLNLSETLSTQDGQQAFLDYLKEAGINTERFKFYPLRGPYLSDNVSYRFRIDTYAELIFDKRGITLSGQRQQIKREDIVRVFNAAQGYASLINQQNILNALTQMGFIPQEFSYTADGELSFSVEIGV